MFYLHNDPRGGFGVAWNDRFKNLGVGKGIASIIHFYFFFVLFTGIFLVYSGARWAFNSLQIPIRYVFFRVFSGLFDHPHSFGHFRSELLGSGELANWMFPGNECSLR